MRLYLSRSSRKLIYLQRRTTVLDFGFEGVDDKSQSTSSSSDNLDDMHSENKLLERIQERPLVKEDDPNDYALRRGISVKHPMKL